MFYLLYGVLGNRGWFKSGRTDILRYTRGGAGVRARAKKARRESTMVYVRARDPHFLPTARLRSYTNITKGIDGNKAD